MTIEQAAHSLSEKMRDKPWVQSVGRREHSLVIFAKVEPRDQPVSFYHQGYPVEVVIAGEIRLL